MEVQDKTDEEIVTLVQNGSTDFFGELVDRYEKKLQRYARRFLFQQDDVDDLVQEVFLKAFSNLQGFNTQLSFSSWIYRIAHNTFINKIKKREHEPMLVFDADTIFGAIKSEEKTDTETLNDENKEFVEMSLDKLPPKYREVVVLLFFEEMSYKEISDILKIPTSTVGVRISRAKKQLRKILEAEGKKINTNHD